MTYYCCLINCNSLGDTVLQFRTMSKRKAQRWVENEGHRNYIARHVFSHAEYTRRMKQPQHHDSDPW